jgi:hypothetical protein
MKLKIIMVLLFVLVAVVGFSAGHFQAVYSSGKDLERLRKLREAAHDERVAANDLKELQRSLKKLEMSGVQEACYKVSKNLGILRAFHTGDTNGAIRDLERDLEGSVAILLAAVKELPPGKESTRCIRLLRVFQDYRAAHPPGREESLLSEEQVRAIFSLTSTNSGGQLTNRLSQ